MSRPFTYETIPAELRDIPNWVLWKKVWRDDKQKFDKIPTQATGYPASITNRQHFSTFENALFAQQLGVADGIGFCFTPDTDLVFVDLDQAVNCVGWDESKLPILQAFPTWGELSQSEKGVHLIARGNLDKAHVYHPAGLELYTSGRFCAMTGWVLQDWPTEIVRLQPAIDQLAAHIDTLRGSNSDKAVSEVGPTPILAAMVPELETLEISKEVYQFLTEGIADKWQNDRSVAMFAAASSLYRARLPDDEVLTILWQRCGHIAAEHRTNGNALDWLWKYCVGQARNAAPPTVETLFSALPTAKPDAWASLCAAIREIDMANVTDSAALGRARNCVLRSLQLADATQRTAARKAIMAETKWTKAELGVIESEITRAGRKLQQGGVGSLDELLSGYVYVASQHCFLHKATNELLKPEAFLALHGHLTPELREMVLAGGGTAKVTGLDFAPAEPGYFKRKGALYYNTWSGLADRGMPGNIDPWAAHMNLLVPDETNRGHLLNWMAYTLQHPENKINHCIVFGGNPGIGKDTLFWPLSQALGRHAQTVGADALTRDFNDFLVEAKLVTIQEADLGSHREANMVANRMKPLICSPPDTLHINPKGSRAFNIRNVVHLVLYSNEAHPVMISRGDRRYFVLSSHMVVTTPSGAQRAEVREYFADLWAWMQGRNGWRHVVDYLLTRDVSRFDPKAAPPMTDTKLDIIEAGQSPLESLLAEAAVTHAGPLANDLVESFMIHRWLATSGVEQLALYGLREVPSIPVIGRALAALGATQERGYVNGTRVRLMNVAPLRAPVQRAAVVDMGWLN